MEKWLHSFVIKQLVADDVDDEYKTGNYTAIMQTNFAKVPKKLEEGATEVEMVDPFTKVPVGNDAFDIKCAESGSMLSTELMKLWSEMARPELTLGDVFIHSKQSILIGFNSFEDFVNEDQQLFAIRKSLRDALGKSEAVVVSHDIKQGSSTYKAQFTFSIIPDRLDEGSKLDYIGLTRQRLLNAGADVRHHNRRLNDGDPMKFIEGRMNSETKISATQDITLQSMSHLCESNPKRLLDWVRMRLGQMGFVLRDDATLSDADAAILDSIIPGGADTLLRILTVKSKGGVHEGWRRIHCIMLGLDNADEIQSTQPLNAKKSAFEEDAELLKLYLRDQLHFLVNFHPVVKAAVANALAMREKNHIVSSNGKDKNTVARINFYGNEIVKGLLPNLYTVAPPKPFSSNMDPGSGNRPNEIDEVDDEEILMPSAGGSKHVGSGDVGAGRNRPIDREHAKRSREKRTANRVGASTLAMKHIRRIVKEILMLDSMDELMSEEYPENSLKGLFKDLIAERKGFVFIKKQKVVLGLMGRMRIVAATQVLKVVQSATPSSDADEADKELHAVVASRLNDETLEQIEVLSTKGPFQNCELPEVNGTRSFGCPTSPRASLWRSTTTRWPPLPSMSLPPPVPRLCTNDGSDDDAVAAASSIDVSAASSAPFVHELDGSDDEDVGERGTPAAAEADMEVEEADGEAAAKEQLKKVAGYNGDPPPEAGDDAYSELCEIITDKLRPCEPKNVDGHNPQLDVVERRKKFQVQNPRCFCGKSTARAACSFQVSALAEIVKTDAPAVYQHYVKRPDRPKDFTAAVQRILGIENGGVIQRANGFHRDAIFGWKLGQCDDGEGDGGVGQMALDDQAPDHSGGSELAEKRRRDDHVNKLTGSRTGETEGSICSSSKQPRVEEANVANDVLPDPERSDDDDVYESMWSSYDGIGQRDDAPEGSTQTCYWTDGMMLERTKVNGKWEYSSYEM